MMKIKMHVAYEDGSGVDVEASMPDFIAFERKYDKPVQAFANDPRIEYMTFLAWHNLSRKKITQLEFDDWINTLASLEIGEEEEIVPLDSNQPIGS